ncbi:MAG: amidohydrolase family protein [Anaerolineae bacterium]
MRVDAHQHFWRYSDAEYGWIGADMALLRRDFLPDDLLPLLHAAGFDASVAVQARQSLVETEWLLDLAAANPFIVAVVGWVDLCSPDVEAQLRRFAANRRFRGVRHVLQDEPDDRYMLRPDFLRGMATLAEHDLTYDILVYPRQLPAAADLAGRFPRQRFVLDHVAKPRIREGIVQPWADELRRLAEHDNVSCKLSGMVTEADWSRWHPDDLRPYIDVAWEAFGPERLMIGSDWPVCTVAGAYAQVMAVVSDYAAALPTGERDAILGGNAARAYGLDRPSPVS